MISFDPANATASRIGAEHGITDGELDEAVASAGGLCKRYSEECSQGKYGFARLPYKELAARQAEGFAKERSGSFRNFVQVGIGGSALGATAIHSALCDRFHNDRGTKPRYYALDNVDPEETRSLLEMLDPKETLYHVVTKSGDTTETMAGFLSVLDRVKRACGEAWKERLVLTTDPEKGFLRAFAREHAIPAFDLPSDVGGRFSVLTPVGLLPAAMLGVDVHELLDGAADAHEACEGEDPLKNPGWLFAAVAHLLDARKGKRIHVMMPYARALRDTADWFRQLWAESLGKNVRTGPTPARRRRSRPRSRRTPRPPSCTARPSRGSWAR
jgi:glucose-6-phosphate isomerase